jgi:hypothetical protein
LGNQKEYSRSTLKKKLEEFVSQGRDKFYLREIVEEAHVTVVEAEDFFIPLLRENELEGNLEVRCPTCGADLGTYKRYPEIPEKLSCENCGTEFPRSDEYLNIVLEVKGKFFRAQEISSTSHTSQTYQTRNERVIERCYRRTKRCNERKDVRALL